MKFYKRDPDRALAGMAELTFEQRGAYNSLLDLLYSRDGEVPDDDERVARMLSCNKREWVRLKKSLIELGKVWVKSGKIGAKRVQETINEATEFSNKQRSNVSKRWVKPEKPHDNNDVAIPDGNSTARQSGNTSTPTATPTPTILPPKGGEDAKPEDFPTMPAALQRRPFEAWETALFAIEGVKGSSLEISAYHAMVAIMQEGYDLHAEVLPIVKADVARAIQQGRANRLSWATIARKIREAREQGKAIAPPPQPVTDAKWGDRLTFARQTQTWDAKWGPYPNQPGCLAPAALVSPDDGKGWTDYQVKRGAA
jgi:uncharacterized protein YdaU (DUF1376 family)